MWYPDKMACRPLARLFAQKLLRLDTINLNLIKAQYAVRGEVVKRQGELEQRMNKGAKMPFVKFTPCNIGNPHVLGQKPLTFLRQV